MDTPDRSTAAAFPRYLTGEVVADSVALQWAAAFEYVKKGIRVNAVIPA